MRGRGKVIYHFETISSLINILPRVLLMESMFTRKIFVYTVSSVVKIIAKGICLQQVTRGRSLILQRSSVLTLI